MVIVRWICFPFVGGAVAWKFAIEEAMRRCGGVPAGVFLRVCVVRCALEALVHSQR